MPDLDAELRRLARALVEDAPPAPSYHEVSGIASVPVLSPDRRVSRAVAAVVAVALAAGLVLALALRDRSSTRHQPLAPPKHVPCTPRQLRAVFGFAQGGGLDSVLGSVIFTNTGDRKCAIQGRPDVEIVGDQGRLSLTQGPGGRAPTAGLRPREPIIVQGRRGSEAGVLLEWHNWCHGSQGALTVHVRFARWKASLAATPSNGTDPTLTASCSDPSRASFLFVDYARVHDATGFH